MPLHRLPADRGGFRRGAHGPADRFVLPNCPRSLMLWVGLPVAWDYH